MKSIFPERWQKPVLLGGLYTSQMLSLAFVFTALPALLRQSGTELADLGWMYALGLIWSLKFLWAPLVDRFGSIRYGHYRSWIIVMQTLVIITLVATSFISFQNQLTTLGILFSFIALFSATQDIAVDALAVTILTPAERGMGNSIQSAGNLLGVMLGGGFILITFQWFGWQGSMLFLASAIAIPLISIVYHNEKQAPADIRPHKAGFRDLIHFFHRPRICPWVFILVVFRLGNMAAYGLVTPLLVDLGWSLDRIGIYISIIGSFFGIIGALLSSWFIARYGRKKAMLGSLLLALFASLGLLFPAQGIDNPVIVSVAVCLIMCAYGSGAAVLYTVIMDKSDPASAGTDFTLQITISNIPTFLAGGLVLGLADAFGYTWALLSCVSMVVLSIISVFYLYDDFETTTTVTASLQLSPLKMTQ